jgi:hypothetical protein
VPNRTQQKRTRRRERRKQIISGRKAQLVRFRRIRNAVAEMGPEVSTAMQFFRNHDFDPDAVRTRLEGPAPWAFVGGEGIEGDSILLTKEARDMILGLMRTA